MTAEIAILNKNAVALAADSAVTLRNPETQKVYNTANKLFMLSKYHPVGIMIYGPAELMGVPWETLIKVYREELGTTNFDHLGDFATHFVAFIEGNALLFPEAVQSRDFQGMCHWVLNSIREEVEKRVGEYIEANGDIDDEHVGSVVAAVIASQLQEWTNYPRLACYPDGFEGILQKRYGRASSTRWQTSIGLH